MSHNFDSISSSLNNIRLKLGDAAGTAVSAELQIRIIGEKNQLVQIELKRLTQKNYWDCKLFCLEEAIDIVFSNVLTSHEFEILKDFREQRNALLHGDFVTLMILLKIPPTSREILHSGKRPLLTQPNIEEAIKSIERNNGLEKFIQLTQEKVFPILEKLLKSSI